MNKKTLGEEIFGIGQIVEYTYKNEPILLLKRFGELCQVFHPKQGFICVSEKLLKEIK